MEKIVISNSSHYTTKENNRNAMTKINNIIFSKKEKRIFNYFNTDKIYLDDTDGFISFQPTCVEGFYTWITNTKINNIIKFVNKYVEDDDKVTPTIWIGNLLVQK